MDSVLILMMSQGNQYSPERQLSGYPALLFATGKINRQLVRTLTLCAGLLLGCAIYTDGQALKTSEKDTVRIPAGSVFYFEDKEIYFPGDTTIFIPHNSKYYISKRRNDKGAQLFDSLARKAAATDWTNRLHNIIIRAPRQEAVTDTLPIRRSGATFIPYEDKIIRNIYFRKLEPFGPTIFDTSVTQLSPAKQLGNNMHVLSQDRVLRNQLLFKKGDRLDPYLIGDNEKIIRELSFIEDARILVTPVDGSGDSVDVLVLVKDAFSIGLGWEMKDYNAGTLELFNKNIMGFGHEFHITFHWDGDKRPWIGNEFTYIINNISRSFISSHVRYAQVFETETFEFGLDRRFITPDTKYAGAVNYQRTKTVQNIRFSDTIELPVPIKFDRTDIWIGRSIYLSSREQFGRPRANLILAGRYLNEYFYQRPPVSKNIFYDYHQKNIFLFSLGFSQHKFFRSNLIYSFGRTEDIPQGMLFNITAGPEFSEFNSRWYAGFDLSKGGFLRNAGYLYGKVSYGGYMEHIDLIERGIVRARLDYFTNLFIINRYKFRHFISIDYTRGFRRLEDEILNINDEHGIRGFKSDLVGGTQRLVVNYEAVAFSPYYLYGFRFVFFGFSDFGLIGSDLTSVFDNRLHTGLGLGVRIRNERLVFETIQIRIGYYPTLADERFPLVMNFSGEKRLSPKNFYVTRPDIVRFE